MKYYEEVFDFIPVHVKYVKMDEVDNVPIDEATQSIKHIGSVESKLIKGSDGRLYAIEFMRLTPRDANYVEGEKGTKKLSDEGLQKGDTSLYPTYLLRQELLSLFIHRKVNVAHQALLVEAANKEKELSGTTENSASTESKEKEDDLSSMVNYLHRMAVNMRYLGYLAKLASDQEKEDSDLFLTGKQFLVLT